MSPHNKELSPPAGWRVPLNVQALFVFFSFWKSPSARRQQESCIPHLNAGGSHKRIEAQEATNAVSMILPSKVATLRS